MSKIRVLTDQIANQIAAGEVVERPASVAKELVENAIDAGASRIIVETEAGGRQLLRVTDDGEGMTRDDAVLAFERHATSKISTSDDLARIGTLGFRGEALASIASVARVELITKTASEPSATRVVMEGGKMRDVAPAAHPQGTTLAVRDLFFNVPARRKFLRSEATETFHLTNLVTHYALANPQIAFTLTNNGREILRAAAAKDLRERTYQIFGREFSESLLEVRGGRSEVALVTGFISAPRERRTSRDAQYLFVNRRYVRDRLISRALSEGYRGVLPPGSYPVALLFLETSLDEVDVNVHPAKTEVRFRRTTAISDAVQEAVRGALASSGYAKQRWEKEPETFVENWAQKVAPTEEQRQWTREQIENQSADVSPRFVVPDNKAIEIKQKAIEFVAPASSDQIWREALSNTQTEPEAVNNASSLVGESAITEAPQATEERDTYSSLTSPKILPSLPSALGLVREIEVASLAHTVHRIRPLGQLEDSFIIATDETGLLLIDQHIAHERILFEKYQADETTRASDAQHLLMPETFELTPAQAAAFDSVAEELESYGFALMRLSGRTVAIKAVPVDLPPAEARNLLSEVLETMDAEKRGMARAALRSKIAAVLACRAAVNSKTPLTAEKMRWLIDRLLQTTSPTTSPHGRPAILRINTSDLLKGFQRPA